MRLIVLPGDGIGPEIAQATLAVLGRVGELFALPLEIVEDVAGHESLKRYGTTVRPELLDTVRAADGLLLGPTATFEFRDEVRGEINPSMFFRKQLDLFANIRPSRTFPSLGGPVGAFDLVVVRENTEGFYADRNMAAGNGEILVTPDVSISLRRITRFCSERIARAAFDLAATRRRRVTIVHKANVLKVTDGMFLDACRRVAADYPGVEVDDLLIDAMMAHLVRKASRFDVIVTSNMYGDILSDLTAELSGSIGLGGALNFGAEYAMGQAVHGSAPDIAGQDLANPLSLILSGAMLLDWHGERRKVAAYKSAAAAIRTAIEEAVVAREVTRDLGGPLGTQDAGRALAARLRAA